MTFSAVFIRLLRHLLSVAVVLLYHTVTQPSVVIPSTMSVIGSKVFYNDTGLCGTRLPMCFSQDILISWRFGVIPMEFILTTVLCFCQDLEKVLDVFNITLARQQAQMEVNFMKNDDHTELFY